MKHNLLKIATRKSPLALWQTDHVREALRRLYPEQLIEIVEITTQGDKILDTPLATIGGKGLFVKELENSLLAGQADMAVHSMKDVPVELPRGLILSVIMSREEPYDAFVSNHYPNLAALPLGAIVGTSSLRRQSQLLALRPDLSIRPLRGNVGTRLQKLDRGEFDAIVLAVAGLKRLGMGERIRERLTADIILPAIGQGAIGIECREDDRVTQERIAPLNDYVTQQRLKAERAINQRLGGGCQVPIAGFAEISDNELLLRGLVADPQGKQVLYHTLRGALEFPEELGDQLAQVLLSQGADRLLQTLQFSA
jgi:hydroxymethylbilane synthase